jgi:F0F1-type ATP synthase delta subunit
MIHPAYSIMKAVTQPEFFDDVTRHYAKVFNDLPQDVLSELAAFVQWAKERPLRRSLLKEGSLPLWWHEALFQEFFQLHKSQELTLRVLRVLSAQKRLEILPDILAVLIESKRPDCVMYWHTSKMLSDTELAKLETTLSHHFGKPVTVHQKEKPELLLGGVLLWCDLMIDLSLNTMLSNLHTEIDHVFTCS